MGIISANFQKKSAPRFFGHKISKFIWIIKFLSSFFSIFLQSQAYFLQIIPFSRFLLLILHPDVQTAITRGVHSIEWSEIRPITWSG